jgi:Flp pilus assembly protein TadG
MRLTRRLFPLGGDARGVSLVEFGLFLPVLMLVGAGGLEMINLILAHQKIERIASIASDNIARNTLAPSERSFIDTFAGVREIARPFTMGPDGRVILTGVIGTQQNDRIVGKVVWQRCGGQLPGIASKVGTEWRGSANWADGPDAVLPNNLQLTQNQLVVVAEVAYRYRPLISLAQVQRVGSDRILRQRSVYVARGQAYTSITPVSGITPATC